MTTLRISSIFAACAAALLAPDSASAQHTLTKLLDFRGFKENDPLETNDDEYGPARPYDTPILIGDELWFTTESGGNFGFGSVAKFDLATNTLSMLYGDLEVNVGNSPQSELVADGDLLFFTNNRGGTGDRGTLSVFDRTTFNYTRLWDAPPISPNTNPTLIPGSPTIVDRGVGGKDIYFMTQNGGTGGTGTGTIQRHNTLLGTTTTIHNFVAAPSSRQPFKGFTRVGHRLYFTTFTGGNAGPGYTNGAGTLNVLEVTTSGAEVLTQLARLPAGDGSTRFPGHRPYYRAADHSLYFCTTGTSLQPGSLQKYDLSTGQLTTLGELQGAASSSGPFPEGRFAYGFPAEHNRALYFTTIQGGNIGGGTINRYDLTTGAFEVLFHLDSNHTDLATPENIGGEPRGGMLFSDHGGTPAFYLTPRQGGDFDDGTLLKLGLPATESAIPTYTQWIDGIAPTAGPEVKAPTANPDGDGENNLGEFAFGMSPLVSDVLPRQMMPKGSGGYVLRWTGRNDGSVVYTVTTNADLTGTWATVGGTPAEVIPADQPVPTGYTRYEVNLPGGPGSAFFRVEATLQPSAIP